MTEATKRTTGMVKWFDSRGGFGFITILKGDEHEGKDIFVHYSTLTTSSSQYKYLVLGEYVEFVLAKAENEKYEYFAQSVTGLRGGNLMCESRRLSSLEFEHPKPTRKEGDDHRARKEGDEHHPKPVREARKEAAPKRAVPTTKRTYSSTTTATL
jgi:cold shock CspA family protein